jgi:hypothetical protein
MFVVPAASQSFVTLSDPVMGLILEALAVWRSASRFFSRPRCDISFNLKR